MAKDNIVPGAGQPVEPHRLDAVVSVRMSGEEAAELRDAANAEGVGLSAFLRARALASVRGPRLNMTLPGAPIATTIVPPKVEWVRA